MVFYSSFFFLVAIRDNDHHLGEGISYTTQMDHRWSWKEFHHVEKVINRLKLNNTFLHSRNWINHMDWDILNLDRWKFAVGEQLTEGLIGPNNHGKKISNITREELKRGWNSVTPILLLTHVAFYYQTQLGENTSKLELERWKENQLYSSDYYNILYCEIEDYNLISYLILLLKWKFFDFRVEWKWIGVLISWPEGNEESCNRCWCGFYWSLSANGNQLVPLSAGTLLFSEHLQHLPHSRLSVSCKREQARPPNLTNIVWIII